jgi:hypothetical protein
MIYLFVLALMFFYYFLSVRKKILADSYFDLGVIDRVIYGLRSTLF